MTWVATGIAVAGLGLSLWDRKEQSEANKDLAKQMKVQKGQIASSKSGVGQALSGELELISERKGEQKEMLTEKGSQELKTEMAGVLDSGATFAGSFRDTQKKENIEGSVWQGYQHDSYNIDTSADDARLGAYSSAYSSVSDLDNKMAELESQINQLS